MYSQTVATMAAIMLLAFASSLHYALGSVNGMNNVTNASGSSKIMPNNTFGCIGTVTNLNIHSNLPRCATP